MPSIQQAPEPRRIGEYLPCSPAAIEWAVSVQNTELTAGNVKRLGEILLEREHITQEELLDALQIQRIDRMRQCPILENWSSEDLATLSRISEEVCLETGENLLWQDQRGDSLYLITCGRLLMYRRSERQETMPVGVALAGDILGEKDYFSGGTRSFSAWAIEPAILMKIRYDFLSHSSRNIPEPLMEFREILAKRCAADPCLNGIPDLLDISIDPGLGARTESLIDRICRRACRVMQADGAYLFLLEPETGDFLANIAKGKEIREFRVRAGKEVAGWVAQTGELLNLPEANLDLRFDPEIDVWTSNWTSSLLAGPVRNLLGEVIAVLQVINRKDGLFTPEDEVLFRAFVHQSTIPIANCWEAMKKWRSFSKPSN